MGYPLANGEVLATFPHIEDQLRFVYYGTANYTSPVSRITANLIALAART